MLVDRFSDALYLSCSDKRQILLVQLLRTGWKGYYQYQRGGKSFTANLEMVVNLVRVPAKLPLVAQNRRRNLPVVVLVVAVVEVKRMTITML